jgi:alpha-glucuronidase
LWFNSLGEEQTLSSTKTTMAILQNELNNHWEGKQVVNVKLLAQRNEELGNEGYVIDYNADSVVIFANTQVAALYGTYDLIRMQESGQLGKKAFSKTELPAFHNRILNHWDNPNGTIERGYAGKSLWKWNELPDKVSPVYEEYARANASIGINGTVLNNVNADPKMLTAEYLQKVKVLADIFRPYGLKVYLSLNFASPKHLGNLKTSDPLDKDVIKWWNDKVKEIYSIIPDFGGFLVKANSEGQSGPQDYGRTHADGANMIADAVAPYGGIVMWRAFVYDAQSPDRAKQACEEFVPLDGQFRDNVIIQIKNGPVDFQPREPFSPLFGQLENTNVMAEFQITQEYLGFSNHLVYLHPMWKECLDSDTYQKGEGSTVAEITKGVTHSRPINAIAGVTNIGDSINWCGHHFAQSNWYAYGRMAWNPELSSEQIADEWIKQTFSSEKKFIEPVKNMMLMSRETNVKYEMPLGLHHIFSGQGHYGPGPWEGASRPDWSPLYYHKAAKDGIGFDRTMNGSAAVEQYHEPLKSLYNNVETCPENLILWFHHLPWDYKMKSGRTLWDELCYTYQEGIDEAASFIKVWESVEKYVDSQRYENIHRKIVRQAKDAIWWRDACMLYFQTFSGMPIPEDCTAPQHTLEELRRVRLGISNYETPALEKLPAYELK